MPVIRQVIEPTVMIRFVIVSSPVLVWIICACMCHKEALNDAPQPSKRQLERTHDGVARPVILRIEVLVLADDLSGLLEARQRVGRSSVGLQHSRLAELIALDGMHRSDICRFLVGVQRRAFELATDRLAEG